MWAKLWLTSFRWHNMHAVTTSFIIHSLFSHSPHCIFTLILHLFTHYCRKKKKVLLKITHRLQFATFFIPWWLQWKNCVRWRKGATPLFLMELKSLPPATWSDVPLGQNKDWMPGHTVYLQEIAIDRSDSRCLKIVSRRVAREEIRCDENETGLTDVFLLVAKLRKHSNCV